MRAVASPSFSELLTRRELRQCAGCGTRFVGLSWRRQCWDCDHAASQPFNRPAENVAFKQAQELKQLKAELESARLELSLQRRCLEDAAHQRAELERANAALALERDQWKHRYHAMLVRSGGRSTLPPDILRRLLWLCHPDRQGGDEDATAATAWLLAQRPKRPLTTTI